MPKYCPYCGAQIKESDRFCIVCGKPMLSNIKGSKDSKEEEPEDKEEEPDLEEEKDDKKKSTKEDKKKGKEEPEKKVVHLPPDAKEFYDIKTKKRVLSKKLDDYLKQMKDDRYETDYDFKEKINVQIKAAQTLVADIKQKEAELLAGLDNKYILKKLKVQVSEKRDQLKNLTQQYKLRKLKKDVFNNLKETYKAELKVMEADRDDLILGINTWLTELGTEKVKLSNEQNILEGRFKAKEITDKNEYQEKYDEYTNKINNLEIKIETLEKVLKGKD